MSTKIDEITAFNEIVNNWAQESNLSFSLIKKTDGDLIGRYWHQFEFNKGLSKEEAIKEAYKVFCAITNKLELDIER